MSNTQSTMLSASPSKSMILILTGLTYTLVGNTVLPSVESKQRSSPLYNVGTSPTVNNAYYLSSSNWENKLNNLSCSDPDELLKASVCDVYTQLMSKQQSLGDEINRILSQNISKLYLTDQDDLWD